MKDRAEVDENKYDHLTFADKNGSVLITSSLERDQLVLLTDEGDIL